MHCSRTVLLLIFPVIILFVGVSVTKAGLDDLAWERQGQARFAFGWYEGEGLFDEKEPDYGLKPGVGFSSNLNTSGRISDDCRELNYYIYKMPGKDAEIYLQWNGLGVEALYNCGIELALPEVNLAFKNNAIDGFKLHTLGNGLTIFAGEQYYYPKQLSFIIDNPYNNFYQIFDLLTPRIILGGGTIVDGSELVTLNGEILTRGSDYKLDYLNGRMWLHCPFNQGDLVEIKFQFVYSKEYRIPGELLKGAIISQQTQESVLTGYYFTEGELKKIVGTAGVYGAGPLTIKGEWAIAENEGTTQAYYVDCILKEENLELSYQVREIDPGFQEIGTNTFTGGKLQNFSMKHTADVYDFSLHRKYSTLPVSPEGWQKTTTTGVLQGEVIADQYYQLIFEERIEEERGESKTEKDLAIGYVYDRKPLKLSYLQYLQDIDHRIMYLNIRWPKVNITGNYGIETRRNEKMHKTKFGMLYEPSERLQLDSNIEYKRYFKAEKGDILMNIKGIGTILPGLSGTGEFTFDTNYKLNSGYSVEQLMLNYGDNRVSANLYFYRTDVKLVDMKHYAQEIIVSSTFPLLKFFFLGYNFHKSDTGHFPIEVSLPGEETEQIAHTISLNYNLKQNLIFKANLELSQNCKWSIADETSQAESSIASVYGLGVDYQADDRTKFICSLSYTPIQHEGLLTVLNDIKCSILGTEISLKGKTILTFPQRKQTSGEHEVGIVFPKVNKIQTRFSYKNEYWNLGGTGCKNSYSILVKYLHDEHRSTFLEVKRYECQNWSNPIENYQSMGLFSGVEFNF